MIEEATISNLLWIGSGPVASRLLCFAFLFFVFSRFSINIRISSFIHSASLWRTKIVLAGIHCLAISFIVFSLRNAPHSKTS